MTVRSSRSEMTAASSSVEARRMGEARNDAIMHKKQNAKKLSKAEKKRMAALIGREKRREQMGRPAKKAKLASSRPVTTAASNVSRRRTRAVSKTDTEESTSSSEEDDSANAESEEEEEEETTKKPLSRAEAARLGWARRKKMLAAMEMEAEKSTSSSDEEDEEEEEEEEESEEEDIPKEPLSRSEAARLGWQRRKKMLAEAKKEEAKRRAAAKMGWQKRKKLIEAAKTKRQIAAKSKRKPSRSKGYGAAARARAAKRGWERRKLILAGVDPDDEQQPKNSDTTEGKVKDDNASRQNRENMRTGRSSSSTVGRSTEESTSSKGTKPAWLKSKPREGAKRSRRLAVDSSDSHEESARKMNELVSFLKDRRGWMEFHPSSRLGSGTHTYGYIPSSVASFIRGGTVSKSIVLEHGTLGVHYALDYEGHGGLKEMIDSFGVEYSPYPTEEMLEVSREILGNRNAMQVSAWDLGEDLPWKEVEQAEERKVKEFQSVSGFKNETDETSGEEEDLLFVANILASISQRTTEDETEHVTEEELNQDFVCECSVSGNQLEQANPSPNTNVSFDEDSIQRKGEEDDILFIQSQSDFCRWSFGICT